MSRILFALMWLVHWLPFGALAAIGNVVGTLLFWLIAERRRVTRINLAKCFPRMHEAEREHLARAAFRAFCRSFVDRAVLWWAPPERLKRMVRLEGLEHLDAAGPRVVPCVARMLPGGGYVVRLYPAWHDFPSGDDAADARRMMAFIEERVLEMPEQYHWLHKRFKTRPEGEPGFY